MWPKKSEQWRSAWGYDFEWTPAHLTEEQMRALTFSYDTLASECLERLDDLSDTPIRRGAAKRGARASETGAAAQGEDKKQRADLYELLNRHADDDSTLQKLWHEVNDVPEWVDWDQLERGQRVFYRYAGPSIIALTFQSLLGGMAGRRVVETLARTGGFGVNVARRRLLETFHYLLEVTGSIDCIKPGGSGFASSIRVRFLHASVRRRILQLAERKPSYYSIPQHGIPINDLDSLATVISFSAIPLFIGLPRQGVFPTPSEIADYTALWRYLGHLLGAPVDLISTSFRAKMLMESLLLTDINPTETSRILAANIITCLQAQPPTYPSRSLLHAEAHWLNGHALADALGLPRPSLYHTILVAGQCCLLAATCYIRRWTVPPHDEEKAARAHAAAAGRLRRMLRRMAGGERDADGEDRRAGADGDFANHEFKYVPAIGTMTVRGNSGADGDGRDGRGGLVTQLRYLGALLLGSVAVGLLAWLGMRGFLGAVHLLVVGGQRGMHMVR